MNIILASKSPRRRELLQMLGIRDFTVVPSNDPEILPDGLTEPETVMELSRRKAIDVAARSESGTLIIAADTIVSLNGEILGKPQSAGDAAEMLRRLSGKCHTVYTGVTLILGQKVSSSSESTEVFFRDLSNKEISDYITTGEPMDKAGAYGAQGLGALFVERIDGDFFNVMGLPVFRLGLMLKAFGIDILKL